jgi:UDP-glucose 4-epimerase
MLITGGAGFIGSHLCDKYVKEGHRVFCLDNFLSGNLTNIRHLLDYRNFKLVKGDIREYELVEKLVRDVEVIFHLAAQIHVDRSYIEPQLTYDINVIGTQNILEAAKLHDAQKVIYASTSEVYGSARNDAPINEEHPLDSPHPYGASKIAADRMCYAYAQTYHMDISIARPFNIFGPHQRDVGYGGVISIFTRRVLNNTPPIVYGDGLQTRDYTYIDDAVKAYDLILNYKGSLDKPLNFGTGREVSIVDLAIKIIKLCGAENRIKPVFVDPRIGEVKRLIAEPSRAKELLGWDAEYDLDMGLANFVKWYRDYGFEERMKIE